MSVDLLVPSVGESITQGVLARWIKHDGDTVKQGDALFELETEKTTVEVPSPASGILHAVIAEGSTVEIGQKAGTINSGPPASAQPKPEAVITKDEKPGTRLSPSVDLNVAESNPNATFLKPEAATDAPARTSRRATMTPIRKATAQRLLLARQNSAHVTTFNEIDMSKVMDIRAHFREEFEREHGVKIGFMSFFVKACCQALRIYPNVNASIDGDAIIYHDFCDIGVALSIDAGLVVPVVRNADQLHFAGIEAAIVELARKAREKRLLPADLEGGTFTITNGGVFGSLMSTPIPAYPQTAILGLHAIRNRPVVVDEAIVARPMMYAALSYDHQVLDGREAVGFLVKVKEFVEEPDKLLLEM